MKKTMSLLTVLLFSITSCGDEKQSSSKTSGHAVPMNSGGGGVLGPIGSSGAPIPVKSGTGK